MFLGPSEHDLSSVRAVTELLVLSATQTDFEGSLGLQDWADKWLGLKGLGWQHGAGVGVWKREICKAFPCLRSE